MSSKPEYGAAFERLSKIILSQKKQLAAAHKKLEASRNHLSKLEEAYEDLVLQDIDEQASNSKELKKKKKGLKEIERNIEATQDTIQTLERRIAILEKHNSSKPPQPLIEAAQRVLSENELHLNAINQEWHKKVDKLNQLFDAYLAEVASMKELEDLSDTLQNQRLFASEQLPRGTQVFKYAAGVEEKTVLRQRKGPIFTTINMGRIEQTYERGEVFRG